MKVLSLRPTGQYDSSFPSLRSSLLVSRMRSHVPRSGILNRGIKYMTPAESYTAGALIKVSVD
jgi:hypothetical protein